jgi:hypothetical protein
MECACTFHITFATKVDMEKGKPAATEVRVIVIIKEKNY